jgi:hypothetical protein
MKTASWPLGSHLASNGESRFLAFPPTAEQLQNNKAFSTRKVLSCKTSNDFCTCSVL